MNELEVLPNESTLKTMKEIALLAVKSKLLPNAIQTPEQALIIMMKGRELGLPPLVAFSHINVIQGKPTMSAEIMLAYIYKDHPGAVIEITEKTDSQCIIMARRSNGTKLVEFKWNAERAKKLGLLSKDNYVKQPGTMYFWRCISEMKRALFPDVLLGIDFFKEELEDSGLRNVSFTEADKIAFNEKKSINDISPIVEVQPEVKKITPKPKEELLQELYLEQTKLGMDNKDLKDFVVQNFSEKFENISEEQLTQLIEMLRSK